MDDHTVTITVATGTDASMVTIPASLDDVPAVLLAAIARNQLEALRHVSRVKAGPLTQ